LKQEGVFHLYKGILSSVILSLYGGIQMTIYQTIKNKLQKSDIEFTHYLGSIIGVFSKMLTSSLLYPFNLIRSKQQQIQLNSKLKLNEKVLNHSIIAENDYANIFKTVRIIYQSNGIKGFYKGLAPLLIRQVPSSTLFFYTYEYILKIFNYD
jgi:solute carrier family 25 folate transporter 32